ncbi:MAG TPA: VCBS repeat-containing protein, partial [Pirellulaceae bacterium]|nr:VCBS repeat-containing protein [Pirellulaceae bacterium]
GQYTAVGSVTATPTAPFAGLGNPAPASDPVNYAGGRNAAILGPERTNCAASNTKIVDLSTGEVLFSLTAYEPAFVGGMSLATAPLDTRPANDGDEIITAPGPGRAPEIRVFSQTGTATNATTGATVPITSFMAYASTFTSGVEVAAGDINNDGVPDIVTVPKSGAQPVRVFYGTRTAGAISFGSSATPTPNNSFFPFGSTYTGGMHVALADVTGDNLLDVIIGSGTSVGAQVKIFSNATVLGTNNTPATSPTVYATFYPYYATSPSIQSTFTGGVYVTTGRVNSDNIPEIIVSPGLNGNSRVEVWQVAAGNFTSTRLSSFFSFYDLASRNAAVIALPVDNTGDGIVDKIATVQGQNGTSSTGRLWN